MENIQSMMRFHIGKYIDKFIMQLRKEAKYLDLKKV